MCIYNYMIMQQNSHAHTPFSRWEPCCIPFQFKKCCHRRTDGHESKPSCCCACVNDSTNSRCCVLCVPVRPFTCIIRRTDSVPEDQQAQATEDITECSPQYVHAHTHLHTHTHARYKPHLHVGLNSGQDPR